MSGSLVQCSLSVSLLCASGGFLLIPKPFGIKAFTPLPQGSLACLPSPSNARPLPLWGRTYKPVHLKFTPVSIPPGCAPAQFLIQIPQGLSSQGHSHQLSVPSGIQGSKDGMYKNELTLQKG